MNAPFNPVDRVLSALREHGYEPHKSGVGWSCRCPAHDDRNPSLSIGVGDDGRALVNCFAGCSFQVVCAAIGLRAADLRAPQLTDAHRTPRRRRRGDGDTTSPKAGNGAVIVAVADDTSGGRTLPTARDAVAELEKRHGPRSACWTYHNSEDEPVGMIVRWDTPSGKDIRPVSRKADGSGWFIGGTPKGVTGRPLYRLPELLATKPGSRVYVTEGEKAADAARALGLTVTTSPHGSRAAKHADWSALAGWHVVILPDHDHAGEQYAEDVARLVLAAGAKSVRIVRLAELWAEMPEGGDIADLVERTGGDVDAIEQLRSDVVTLVDASEPEMGLPDASAELTFTPFPVNVLPEPIRSFVADAAESLVCDPSYIALPILSGLASAIGNTHRIRLKPQWTEPAIVWTAIVGESGTAKSPAIELALRSIRTRQHHAMKDHAAAMKDYTHALAIYERDAAQWKRSKADVAPPTKPDSPVADRCWTDDTTTEALAVLLQQNPRGLLMVRDELAGWFNFDRYAGGKGGGGDAAKWLEMFGGRPMVVDRKSTGTLYVPRAAVSIAGGIQPQTLRRALGQEHRDNGLAARLLLANPPRKPKRWTEAAVSPDTDAAVMTVFERLYALTSDTDEAGDECPRLMTLADDGKAAWVTFYDEHAREQVNLSGDEAAAWSKLEGYAARLALVIHLTRRAAGDPTLRDPAQVDSASITSGVRLSRWFGDEVRRVYAMLSETEDDREIRQLLDWIERKGGVITVRDLTRGPCKYRGDTDGATKALGDLVAAGIGRWEANGPGRSGGRPTDRFRLLPRHRDGDETIKNAENQRSSVAVAGITTSRVPVHCR